MSVNHRIWIRFVIILGLVLVGVLGTVKSVQAVEIINGDNIPAGTVVDDDVFIAGDAVVIGGTVNGDLFAAGRTVTINGTVNGSLVVAGQTIVINGLVAGSVYGGSSSMELGPVADVRRNLYYGGFSLHTLPGSKIGRDLLMGGYQALLDGETGRDLLAGLGALELTGKIGGDVDVEVGQGRGEITFMPPIFLPPGSPAPVEPGIRVSDKAQIGGELRYVSAVDQTNSIQITPGGGVVYLTPVPNQKEQEKPRVSIEMSVGSWILARLREILTLLVMGSLAVWLLPGLLGRWSARVRATPLPAVGWGMVVLSLGYIGALAIALAVLGGGIFLAIITLRDLSEAVFGIGFSSLGLVFTTFLLFVSYGSKIIVSYLAGKMILAQLAPQSADHKFWPLLVGVLVYVIFRSIPFLGWLIGLLVTLLGLGAVWLVYRDEKQPPLRLAT